MSSQDEESQNRSVESAAAVMSLAYATVSLLWLLWYLIPAHQRRLMVMRATWCLRQTAQNAASRAGQRAMGREIRGSSPRYRLPYLLSLAAGAAGRAYNRMRYT